MSMHRISAVLALGLLASCFASEQAFAATAAASFGVSAIVQGSCRASLSPDRATIAATSAVSVTCSHAVSYHVSVAAERFTAPNLVPLGRGLPKSAVAPPAQLLPWVNPQDGSLQALDLHGWAARWSRPS